MSDGKTLETIKAYNRAIGYTAYRCTSQQRIIDRREVMLCECHIHILCSSEVQYCGWMYSNLVVER